MAYETGHQVTGEHRSGLISSKAAYFHQVGDHHDKDYYVDGFVVIDFNQVIFAGEM